MELNSGGQCVVTAECSENAVHDFLLQSDLKGQLKMKVSEPWLGSSIDWNVISYTKGCKFNSTVRAHAWVMGFLLLFVCFFSVFY